MKITLISLLSLLLPLLIIAGLQSCKQPPTPADAFDYKAWNVTVLVEDGTVLDCIEIETGDVGNDIVNCEYAGTFITPQ